MSVDVLCAIHDCALGISPVTSYSGVKRGLELTVNIALFCRFQPLGTSCMGQTMLGGAVLHHPVRHPPQAPLLGALVGCTRKITVEMFLEVYSCGDLLVYACSPSQNRIAIPG